jgi:carbon storage regulator CsrA
MLVLSRRPNEKVLFPTLGVTVEITSVSRNVVRLGIDAPASVPILREEIAAAENVPATKPKPANHRLRNRLHTATLAVHLSQKQMRAGLTTEAEATLSEALREFSELDLQLAADKADSTAPRRPIRTLLVEDDCNESVLLAEFLRLHGINVQMAHDGQDALDYLRSHERPDVILLDMRMPRCDGPATLAAIRGDAANDATKIFAVSGTDPHDFSLPNGSRGVDGWFTKPVNPGKLVEEMNLALSRN